MKKVYHRMGGLLVLDLALMPALGSPWKCDIDVRRMALRVI